MVFMGGPIHMEQLEVGNEPGHLRQSEIEATISKRQQSNESYGQTCKLTATLEETKVEEERLATVRERDDITLYPFAHQVGGHRQLLTLDKSTLCKPLVPRELLFYLNVPKELIKFVPAYKGVVQINEINPENYHTNFNQPIKSGRTKLSRPFSELKFPNDLPESIPKTINKNSNTLPRDKQQPSWFPFELRVQLRPFSDEKMLKKNLSQENLLKADYISRPNEKYLLLLENVASKYRLPCILDLKMGTRQHDDNASEEKRHRQIAKCQASTSASLGVRLCGMQVYQVDYGGYLWYDKYCGRKMSEEDLTSALREFFQHGKKVRQNKTNLVHSIIDEIIERLKMLHEAVEKSPSFRFYGTSLLIVHESCQILEETNSPTNVQSVSPVDVRLIDFAHTICDLQTGNLPTTKGHCGGVRANSSPSILRSTSAGQLDSIGKVGDESIYRIPEECFDHLTKQQTEDTQLAQTNNHAPSQQQQQQTDIHDHEQVSEINEMASGKHQCLVGTKSSPIGEMGDMEPPQAPTIIETNQPAYSPRRISRSSSAGPDKGLLFGLENLMRLLSNLKNETLLTGY